MKLTSIYAEVLKMTELKENHLEFEKTSKNLLKKLMEEINLESANAKGGNSAKLRYKAGKDSLSKDTYRPALCGTWEENGYQCICNGFTGYMLSDKIEGLPVIPENSIPMKLSEIFKDMDKTPTFEIKLDIKDVKKKLDLAKALKGKKKLTAIDEGIYHIGNKNVDVEYLYNTMLLIGEDAEILSNENNDISAIYFVSGKGKGILLPLRK